MLTPQLIALALRAAANALDGTAGPITVAQAAVQPGAQPGAPATTQPATRTDVTSDMLMALIQPHIGDEAKKAALGVAMRSMGINAFGETQPHQYGPLYDLFQRTIAAFPAGAAPATTSII